VHVCGSGTTIELQSPNDLNTCHVNLSEISAIGVTNRGFRQTNQNEPRDWTKF